MALGFKKKTLYMTSISVVQNFVQFFSSIALFLFYLKPEYNIYFIFVQIFFFIFIFVLIICFTVILYNKIKQEHEKIFFLFAKFIVCNS